VGKKSDPLASRVPVREKVKELGGLFFFLCAMFVFISLVSYDAGDIREIKYPPNSPLHNKGGAIGARKEGVQRLRELIVERLFQDISPVLHRTPELDQLMDAHLPDLNGTRLGELEEKLESLLCAYVAAWLGQVGTDGCAFLGDLDTGYILLPDPSRVEALPIDVSVRGSPVRDGRRTAHHTDFPLSAGSMPHAWASAATILSPRPVVASVSLKRRTRGAADEPSASAIRS